jgi:hypothetical protein
VGKLVYDALPMLLEVHCKEGTAVGLEVNCFRNSSIVLKLMFWKPEAWLREVSSTLTRYKSKKVTQALRQVLAKLLIRGTNFLFRLWPNLRPGFLTLYRVEADLPFALSWNPDIHSLDSYSAIQ